MNLVALIVTICFQAPGAAETCDPPVQIPIEITQFECLYHGQQAALEWMAQDPFFEFATVRRWRCEAGERA